MGKRENLKKELILLMAMVLIAFVGVFTSGIISHAASKAKEMVTVMDCSVWSAPNSQVESNRVKKIPAGYKVTVIPDVVKGKDGKNYYQTAKGAYIMAKCFDSANAKKEKIADYDFVSPKTEAELAAEFERLYNDLLAADATGNAQAMSKTVYFLYDPCYGFMDPAINDGSSDWLMDDNRFKHDAYVFAFNYAPVGIRVLGMGNENYEMGDKFVAKIEMFQKRFNTDGTPNFDIICTEVKHIKN